VGYTIEFSDNLCETLKKIKKKNHPVFERLSKKMNEIAGNPLSYKPLGNVLKGCRRIHVGSFVLIFEVDEGKRIVKFIRFTHHDEAYG
jgi:YafQ family addiction module toxin component